VGRRHTAGGDFVFGANVLAGMARQMICLGHPHDALDFIHLAKQRVDRIADPRVPAMLDTREAWHSRTWRPSQEICTGSILCLACLLGS
jgi:hypothetical protein